MGTGSLFPWKIGRRAWRDAEEYLPALRPRLKEKKNHPPPTTPSKGTASSALLFALPTSPLLERRAKVAPQTPWAHRRRGTFLSPRANQAHGEGAEEDNGARDDAFLSAERLPALVAEEVDGDELDERGVDEEARGDGVHGPDEHEAKGRVGAVQGVGGEADRLADGGAARRLLDSCCEIGRGSWEKTHVRP